MERLLSVSRELRDKVQENESAVSELLRQCEELREELKAMRQVSAGEGGGCVGERGGERRGVCAKCGLAVKEVGNGVTGGVRGESGRRREERGFCDVF